MMLRKMLTMSLHCGFQRGQYTTYYMHQTECLILAGKEVNLKSRKSRRRKKRQQRAQRTYARETNGKKYIFKAIQFPLQQRTQACFDCEYTIFVLHLKP